MATPARCDADRQRRPGHAVGNGALRPRGWPASCGCASWAGPGAAGACASRRRWAGYCSGGSSSTCSRHHDDRRWWWAHTLGSQRCGWCAAGLLGVLARLVAGREPAWRRHALLLPAALAIGLLLPLANAYTQTRDQAVQQGATCSRCWLAALLLTLGYACLPARDRPRCCCGPAGAMRFQAYAALALIGQAYY
ncbi:MAG: hypothetical protein U0Z44_06765 [Kouleothrix sp.]